MHGKVDPSILEFRTYKSTNRMFGAFGFGFGGTVAPEPAPPTARLDFSDSKVNVTSLCGATTNDILGAVASFCDISITGRFDCCSKAFHVSGFVWNHITHVSASSTSINAQVLCCLNLHHANLRAMSCKTTTDLKNAESFLDQLEYIHIDISGMTTKHVPSFLEKLNPETLKSLSLHCWDYTDRDKVISTLPRLLPSLSHVKLITEPKDEDEFLRAVSKHCKNLTSFHFESERRQFSDSTARLFKKIIDNNRGRLLFVDAHFLSPGFGSIFPNFQFRNIAPPIDDTADAAKISWSWDDLNADCLLRYGVPFERFGTNCPHSFRNKLRDAFFIIADESSKLERPEQLATVWTLFQRYYQEETLSFRLGTACSSLKALYSNLRRMANRTDRTDVLATIANNVLSFLQKCVTFSSNREQLSGLVALNMVAIRNPAFRDFFRAWTCSHHQPQLLRDILALEMIKSNDQETKTLLLEDVEWFQKMGLSLRQHVEADIDGNRLASPFGIIMGVLRQGNMKRLVSLPDFDPFEIKTPEGLSLYDFYIKNYLEAATHGVSIDRGDLSALLQYCVKHGAKSQADVEALMATVLETCRPLPKQMLKSHTYWTRVCFVEPFLDNLPQDLFDSLLQRHYSTILDADIHPEDFVEARKRPPRLLGLLDDISYILWRDLLRTFKSKYLNDAEALRRRLQILCFHSSSYPSMVHDFLKKKISGYPIECAVTDAPSDEEEVKLIRSKLKSACQAANLGPPFSASGSSFSFGGSGISL